MASIAEVKKHNDAIAKQYTDFLVATTKVVFFYSMSNTLFNVMYPDGGNYHPHGRVGDDSKMTSETSSVSGDKMVHDSSNAAFNWGVTFGGPKSPVDVRDTNHKLVGDKYDHRGSQARGAAIFTVMENLKFQQSTLFKGFFETTGKPAKSFKLYNSIDELGFSQYAKNSNIDAAVAKSGTNKVAGATLGYNIVKGFMASGTNGMPNSSGLFNVMKSYFAGG